ncbi:hypothetical protein C7459_102322 [Tumebacillus permanentifrigoris]|uniref:Uncharacterized protein n=1 Tax=Tumebacillus permanentifrigoris TaxID=378543 RepID=A0A316DDM0_9BACL|nr:hypothetical protein C7459_102322 [Tumebacillus permanentifrigoris]
MSKYGYRRERPQAPAVCVVNCKGCVWYSDNGGRPYCPFPCVKQDGWKAVGTSGEVEHMRVRATPKSS